MKSLKLMCLIALSIAVLPISADAGVYDGSKPVLCAVVETFECAPGAECQRGLAAAINIPQFLRIDFKMNTISATLDDGTVKTTEIKNIVHVDGVTILHGVQGARGWSVSIVEANGKMVLSVSGREVGFVVFGACTNP